MSSSDDYSYSDSDSDYSDSDENQDEISEQSLNEMFTKLEASKESMSKENQGQVFNANIKAIVKMNNKLTEDFRLPLHIKDTKIEPFLTNPYPKEFVHLVSVCRKNTNGDDVRQSLYRCNKGNTCDMYLFSVVKVDVGYSVIITCVHDTPYFIKTDVEADTYEKALDIANSFIQQKKYNCECLCNASRVEGLAQITLLLNQYGVWLTRKMMDALIERHVLLNYGFFGGTKHATLSSDMGYTAMIGKTPKTDRIVYHLRRKFNKLYNIDDF